MSDIIHSLEKVQLHNELAQARQRIEELKRIDPELRARAEEVANQIRQRQERGVDFLAEDTIRIIRDLLNAYGTEQTMHIAWRKRGEEAEAELAQAHQQIEELRTQAVLDARESLQQLASAQAALLQARTLIDEASRDNIDDNSEWHNKACEFMIAEQPTDAIRAFVHGLLPEKQEEQLFYRANALVGREHNKLLEAIRANLKKALEVK